MPAALRLRWTQARLAGSGAVEILDAISKKVLPTEGFTSAAFKTTGRELEPKKLVAQYFVIWFRDPEKDWQEMEFVAISLTRLMDPAEQIYLRSRIRPRRFRQLHQKRMRLAWRYAKRLRLDTAALARSLSVEQRDLLSELNDINFLLLKMQFAALVSYTWPGYQLARDRFGIAWREFADQFQMPSPSPSAE